ncbi:hypothetical protein SAMN05661012_06750 [Chitinophaga sancti]|nr:hypothetical protein SAMN05661012_06750 [Chitinophaga sancti]
MEWEENARVKPIHPYQFEINNAIDFKLILLRDLNKTYYTAKRQLTFAIIFKELQKEACTFILSTYFIIPVIKALKVQKACLNEV